MANQVSRSPKAPRLGVWVMNSGASLLRASVSEFAPYVGARKRGPKVAHPVFAEVFPRRLVDLTPAPLGLGLNDGVVEDATGPTPVLAVTPPGPAPAEMAGERWTEAEAMGCGERSSHVVCLDLVVSVQNGFRVSQYI